MSEKLCEDMDLNEYKAWAARYLLDSLITGGIKEMSACLHVVIQNILTNKVFGAAKNFSFKECSNKIAALAENLAPCFGETIEQNAIITRVTVKMRQLSKEILEKGELS